MAPMSITDLVQELASTLVPRRCPCGSCEAEETLESLIDLAKEALK